jgi:hypothetical protein
MEAVGHCAYFKEDKNADLSRYQVIFFTTNIQKSIRHSYVKVNSICRYFYLRSSMCALMDIFLCQIVENEIEFNEKIYQLFVSLKKE